MMIQEVLVVEQAVMCLKKEEFTRKCSRMDGEKFGHLNNLGLYWYFVLIFLLSRYAF
jgi:hypothetical protein